MPYKSKEKRREYRREYYAKNRESILASSRERCKQDPDLRRRRRESSQRWREANREHNNAYNREYRKRYPHYGVIPTRIYRKNLRLKVIEHFGGKCMKCGFDDWRALQIDHINGGGRKSFGKIRPSPVYYHNKLLGETPGVTYQLLCANCNQIKKHENKESSPCYNPTDKPSKLALRQLHRLGMKV